MSNCRNHPTRAGVNTCSQCGDWLCDDCTATVSGQIYCQPCLQKDWAHGHEAHDAAPKAPAYCPPRHLRKSEPSFGLLLLFSMMPPGINYMYEGLIKRGLFILSSFFLAFYLGARAEEPLFFIFIAVMTVACVFDAFRIRRRIIAGECVTDSLDDIFSVVKKYKAGFVFLLIFVLGLSLFSSLSNIIFWELPYLSPYRAHMLLQKCMPVLVILGGLFFIVRSGKKPEAPRGDDFDGNGGLR